MSHGFFRHVALLLFVTMLLSACGRKQELGPPKTVAVREDGVLELRLATFNLRYENGGDPASRSWSQRIAKAVRVTRGMAPDVMGVQEGLHGQVADLRVSLPDFGFHGIGRDDGRRTGEYSGIFFRRDRFEPDVSERGTFWLSATPEKPGSKTWGNEIPRVVTWLRLVDRATGRGFYVFNTHWDHRHQGSRVKAAELIAERIDARTHAGDPVVLMGDFNAVESNPAVAYLAGSAVRLDGKTKRWAGGLRETFLAIHPPKTHRRTLHLWSGSLEGPWKIDHILVSKSARVLEAEVLRDDPPFVSDHFPVTARVEFPAGR